MSRRVGFRRIAHDTTPVIAADLSRGRNFAFSVNHVPVFLKGERFDQTSHSVGICRRQSRAAFALSQHIRLDVAAFSVRVDGESQHEHNSSVGREY